MVTGDRAAIGAEVGRSLGIDRVFSGLGPGEKVEIVRSMQAQPGFPPVIMVGDGVNDAPALALADVGIAMGTIGATVSSDAADAVIVVDRVDRVADAVRIGRRSLSIARQSVLVRDRAQPRRDGICRRRPDRARSSGRCSRRRSTSRSSSTPSGPSEADRRTSRLRPSRRRFRACPDVATRPRDDSSPMSEMDSGKIAWRRGEHGPTYVGRGFARRRHDPADGTRPRTGYRRRALDPRRGDRVRLASASLQPARSTSGPFVVLDLSGSEPIHLRPVGGSSLGVHLLARGLGAGALTPAPTVLAQGGRT